MISRVFIDWALMGQGPHGPGPGPFRAYERAKAISKSPLEPHRLGPNGLPWAVEGRTLMGRPWALTGRAPNGPTWALTGQALEGPLGH